ncbi:MAG: hypothetical protein F2667_13490 [Actinobacteria bacterium]|uniref:Unannotated protein n=1 Tax=freshwater metagenome TaxID=449393 RepID=A0A6J6S7Z2_9ZZZZ|nr:hypothetical protein [Actinomycetota bacterium]
MRILVRASVVLAALSTVLVVSPLVSPAQAAPASLTSTYDCESSFGGGSTKVGVKIDLPSRVREGATLAARPVAFTIRVPEALVDVMRQYGVESLEGSSDDATYRIGKRTLDVDDLVLPRTDVPASGPMVLRGKGTAAAYTAAKAGTFAVRIPQAFTATVVGRTSSGSASIPLSCELGAKAPSKITTLTVTG